MKKARPSTSLRYAQDERGNRQSFLKSESPERASGAKLLSRPIPGR